MDAPGVFRVDTTPHHAPRGSWLTRHTGTSNSTQLEEWENREDRERDRDRGEREREENGKNGRGIRGHGEERAVVESEYVCILLKCRTLRKLNFPLILPFTSVSLHLRDKR